MAQGLAELRLGIESEASLLVALAAPRLRGLGFDVPEWPRESLPHHELYARLEERLDRGAHAAYNALVERIVSFANAYRTNSA